MDAIVIQQVILAAIQQEQERRALMGTVPNVASPDMSVPAMQPLPAPSVHIASDNNLYALQPVAAGLMHAGNPYATTMHPVLPFVGQPQHVDPSIHAASPHALHNSPSSVPAATFARQAGRPSDHQSDRSSNRSPYVKSKVAPYSDKDRNRKPCARSTAVFLHDLEMHAGLTASDPAQLLHYHLEGQVRDDWFDVEQNFLQRQGRGMNWTEMRTAFQNFIGDALISHARIARQQMITTHPDMHMKSAECVTDYTARFRQLSMKMGYNVIDESILVDLFTGGLTPALKNHCATQANGLPWPSFDAAVQAAQGAEFRWNLHPAKRARTNIAVLDSMPDSEPVDIEMSLAAPVSTRFGQGTTTQRGSGNFYNRNNNNNHNGSRQTPYHDNRPATRQVDVASYPPRPATLQEAQQAYRQAYLSANLCLLCGSPHHRQHTCDGSGPLFRQYNVQARTQPRSNVAAVADAAATDDI